MADRDAHATDDRATASDRASGHPVPEAAADDRDHRIEAAANGDRKAAEAVLRQLLPRVRNLVRYLLKGDALVDDVAQNVLMEVLRSLPRFRGEGSLEAWADRICVRVTLAEARRRRSERRRRADAAPEIEVATTRGSSAPPPDAYLARRQAAALLDRLPPEQREAVVLHHVAGLSVPEMAEELGVPFDTAKSRLRLGVGKLRAVQRRQDRARPEDTEER
jgi:RNA polymerase sigma-70 factor (ECF subfamily)